MFDNATLSAHLFLGARSVPVGVVLFPIAQRGPRLCAKAPKTKALIYIRYNKYLVHCLVLLFRSSWSGVPKNISRAPVYGNERESLKRKVGRGAAVDLLGFALAVVAITGGYLARTDAIFPCWVARAIFATQMLLTRVAGSFGQEI